MHLQVQWSATATAMLAVGMVGSLNGQDNSPRQAAIDLIRAGVPVGMVLSRANVGVPTVRERQGSKSELMSELMSRLETSRPDLLATEDGGIVHIEETDLPVDVREVLAFPVSVSHDSAMTATHAVFRFLSAALNGGQLPGVAGSGPMPAPECRIDRPIRIKSGVSSVREYLDYVISQTPGLAWEITFQRSVQEESDATVIRRQRDMTIGLMCPDGTVFRLGMFAV